MRTQNTSQRSISARTLLLPYALVLIVSMAIIQTVIATTGGQITLLVEILTAFVTVGIVIWLWRNYRSLTRVRFGVVIAHAIAFVTVTTSFNAHAAIRTIALGRGPGGFDTAAQDLLTTPWFGVTLVMSAAWGLGLLAHLVGVVLGSGWED